jgi:hypothetical protein
MTNGTNEFGVSFAQIMWISRWLKTHDNVAGFERSQDILFDIRRKHGRRICMVCLDEYTCGLARVLEAREAFPRLNLIYVGGMWNGYTMEAKDYCLEEKIGLFNTKEMTGAFHRDDFWTYHQKDKDGNPIYP